MHTKQKNHNERQMFYTKKNQKLGGGDKKFTDTDRENMIHCIWYDDIVTVNK